MKTALQEQKRKHLQQHFLWKPKHQHLQLPRWVWIICQTSQAYPQDQKIGKNFDFVNSFPYFSLLTESGCQPIIFAVD